MNKTIKTLLIVLLIAMIAIAFTTPVFAEYTPRNVDTTKQVENIDKITDTGEQIIGIIRVVGILLSVGILMVIGVKYMMGSAQEKAEYKKVFIPYIIGAALLFAAAVFSGAIYDFFNGMNKQDDTKDLTSQVQTQKNN